MILSLVISLDLPRAITLTAKKKYTFNERFLFHFSCLQLWIAVFDTFTRDQSQFKIFCSNNRLQFHHFYINSFWSLPTIKILCRHIILQTAVFWSVHSTLNKDMSLLWNFENLVPFVGGESLINGITLFYQLLLVFVCLSFA